jgi:hypothetical protein
MMKGRLNQTNAAPSSRIQEQWTQSQHCGAMDAKSTSEGRRVTSWKKPATKERGKMGDGREDGDERIEARRGHKQLYSTSAKLGFFPN